MNTQNKRWKLWQQAEKAERATTLREFQGRTALVWMEITIQITWKTSKNTVWVRPSGGWEVAPKSKLQKEITQITPIKHTNRWTQTTRRWKTCQSELWTTTKETTTAVRGLARVTNASTKNAFTSAHADALKRMLPPGTLPLPERSCKAAQLTNGMLLNRSS